jgi:hypothetical protein
VAATTKVATPPMPATTAPVNAEPSADKKPKVTRKPKIEAKEE